VLSIHDLGNLRTPDGRDGAAGATTYYERTTRADWESVHLSSPPEGLSMGVCHAFGPHAPADLNGARLGPKDLEQALRGEWRGRAVQNAHDSGRFMGWDCTFSAPKAVSVLYAAASPEARARIEEAVTASAVTVLQALAPEVYTRRGHGGMGREPASFAVCAFMQHLSRGNDSQLHTHVIVPSFGWRADGSVGTLEFHDAYRAKMAVGALFRAELAARLAELGYRVYCDEAGVIRVAGVDPKLEEHFSTRSRQIVAELECRYGPDWYEAASPAQRELVTALTRPRHDPGYVERWNAEAAAAGLGCQWAGAERAREPPFQRPSPEQLQERLDAIVREAAETLTIGGVSALTGEEVPGNAVVERRHIVAEAAARAVDVQASAQEILEAVERAWERGVTITLDAGTTPLSARITTPEMVATEQRLLAQWTELARRGGYRVPVNEARLAGLTAEQRAAVAAMTSDRQVSIVDGFAGTGKTTSLKVARQVYQAAGFEVLGEAQMGGTAQILTHETGIPSRTISLADLHGRALSSNTALVVDEAGLANSVQLGRIVDAAHRSGAKVVLVGDPRQLQARGPGSPLPHLIDATRDLAPEASQRMQEIIRQRDPDLRRVAELAAIHRPAEALREADRQERVVVTASTAEARGRAARVLAEALAQGGAIGITAGKADSQALNQAVREELRALGMLGPDAAIYHVGRREVGLAPGELVTFRANEYDTLGVRTGERAEVLAVNRQTREALVRLGEEAVRMDRESRIMRGGPARFFDGERWHDIAEPERTIVLRPQDIEQGKRVLLQHDYARHVDAAQGVTVERTVVVLHHNSPRLDKQMADVAFTRSREDLKVVVSAEGAVRKEATSATAERAHWPGGEERGAQQLPRLSREDRAETLARAEKLLSRDRPGATTLAYRDAPELAREAYGRRAGHRMEQGAMKTEQEEVMAYGRAR
jgi:conjugative relaxase-like TrwC/TraI family protein